MSDPKPDAPIPPTPLDHTPVAPSTAATLVAEAFGTFLLVLGVISTALFAANFGASDNGTSLGVGFVGVSLAVLTRQRSTSCATRRQVSSPCPTSAVASWRRKPAGVGDTQIPCPGSVTSASA